MRKNNFIYQIKMRKDIEEVYKIHGYGLKKKIKILQKTNGTVMIV